MMGDTARTAKTVSWNAGFQVGFSEAEPLCGMIHEPEKRCLR